MSESFLIILCFCFLIITSILLSLDISNIKDRVSENEKYRDTHSRLILKLCDCYSDHKKHIEDLENKISKLENQMDDSSQESNQLG